MRKKLRNGIKLWRWYQKHRWNSVVNMQASWKRSMNKDLADQIDEMFNPKLKTRRNNAIHSKAHDLLYPLNPGGNHKTLTTYKTIDVHSLGQYHKRYNRSGTKKNIFLIKLVIK